MPTDLEIANAATPEPIEAIAWKLGISSTEITPMGKSVAKITWDALKSRFNKPQGSLILVTSVNPTPFGEGKTVTTIGLLKHYVKSVNQQPVLFVNHQWALSLVSKAVLLAVDTPKYCQWKTLTYTSPVTYMR